MKQAFVEGRLILIVADGVIDSMDVQLKLDRDRHASLDAELSSKVPGGVGKLFGEGSKLEVVGKKVTNGEYTFQVTKPVILAVLPRRQPQAGVLESPDGNDWRDWIMTEAPHNFVLQKF
jgi:hypothetical protein